MKESTPTTDLVRGARDGDREAWNQLVTRFSPLVWTVVRRVGLDTAEASDAQAATWMKLLTRIDSIRSPESLPGWLRTTARNEAITLVRRRSRLEPTEPARFQEQETTDRSPDDQTVIAEDIRELREALKRLDDTCYELLTLLFGRPEMSYSEVAETIGRPIGAIGPTRQRCLERLRREMA